MAEQRARDGAIDAVGNIDAEGSSEAPQTAPAKQATQPAPLKSAWAQIVKQQPKQPAGGPSAVSVKRQTGVTTTGSLPSPHSRSEPATPLRANSEGAVLPLVVEPAAILRANGVIKAPASTSDSPQTEGDAAGPQSAPPTMTEEPAASDAPSVLPTFTTGVPPAEDRDGKPAQEMSTAPRLSNTGGGEAWPSLGMAADTQKKKRSVASPPPPSTLISEPQQQASGPASRVSGVDPRRRSADHLRYLGEPSVRALPATAGILDRPSTSYRAGGQLQQQRERGIRGGDRQKGGDRRKERNTEASVSERDSWRQGRNTSGETSTASGGNDARTDIFETRSEGRPDFNDLRRLDSRRGSTQSARYGGLGRSQTSLQPLRQMRPGTMAAPPTLPSVRSLPPQLPQIYYPPPPQMFYPPAAYGMQQQPGMPNKAQIVEAVRKQIEYYFSVENLCKDIFLRAKMDDQGWIPIGSIAQFNRVRMLTPDMSVVTEALFNSPVVEISMDLNLMRARHDGPSWVLPLEQRDPTAHAAMVSVPVAAIEPPHPPPGAPAAETPVHGRPHEDVFQLDEESKAAPRANQDAQQQPANGHFPDADLAKLRVVTQSRGRGGGHVVPEELQASLISDGLIMYEQQLQGSRGGSNGMRHVKSAHFFQGGVDGQSRGRYEHCGIGWFLGLLPTPTSPDQPDVPAELGAGTSIPLSRFQHPSYPQLERSGYHQMPYDDFKERCLASWSASQGGAPNEDMNRLFHFWTNFLRGQFSPAMYADFRAYAKADLEQGHRYGWECLFRFYSYGLEQQFRPDLYVDFEEETIRDYESGSLYGLEKFWAFHHYGGLPKGCGLQVHPKLKALLEGEFATLNNFKVAKEARRQGRHSDGHRANGQQQTNGDGRMNGRAGQGRQPVRPVATQSTGNGPAPIKTAGGSARAQKAPAFMPSSMQPVQALDAEQKAPKPAAASETQGPAGSGVRSHALQDAEPSFPLLEAEPKATASSSSEGAFATKAGRSAADACACSPSGGKPDKGWENSNGAAECGKAVPVISVSATSTDSLGCKGDALVSAGRHCL